MRKLALITTALTLLSGFSAFAQRNDDNGRWSSLPEAEGRGRHEQIQWNERDERDRANAREDRRDDRRADRMDRNELLWSRGDRLPPRYRENSYAVKDYKRYNLRKPPRGQRWTRIQDRYLLVGISNGLVADVVIIDYRDDDRYDNRRDDRRDERYSNARPISRDELWRARYSRAYTIDDDSSYNNCRSAPDPAGVMAGLVVGGLLGRTVAGRGNRTEGTIAGVIAGGAIGAALTNKVECEDRSYMYKTYADGFNGGRSNAYYKWNNPRNDHRGELNVLDYYKDEDDFHCAVYANSVYIDGRREEARGRACQQPDGSWAIID